MRHQLFYSLLLCSSFTLANEPNEPDGPINASVRVPSQPYQSPLKAYQPSAPAALGSWRKANDVVREVGGWKVYLREAQAEDIKPSPTPQHQHK
jgi:hypothetical protein